MQVNSQAKGFNNMKSNKCSVYSNAYDSYYHHMFKYSPSSTDVHLITNQIATKSERFKSLFDHLRDIIHLFC